VTGTRSMKKEDLFHLKWLHGGRFSPDGSKVIYSVYQVDPETEEETSTLYLLDVTSAISRQMTGGKHRDGSPAFSPDGKQIAFVSSRAGAPQIFLLPVDGGEAQQLTTLKQGASNPVWSPDGKHIAFTAGIDRGEKAPDFNKDPYRVTRSIWRFDMIGNLDLAVSNVHVVHVASKESKQLTDDRRLDGSLQWSPDSTRILYTAGFAPDHLDVVMPQVRVVDLDGNAQDLPLERGYINAPHWLPDGKHIVYSGGPNDGSILGTHPNLWIVNVETGSAENRTAGLELSLLGGLEGRMPNAALAAPLIAITPDASSAYVRVQVRGTVEIQRIALKGAISAETVLSGERCLMLQDMRAGKLLYAADDIITTPDLYISNLDGSGERRLTHINDAFLADIAMPETVHLLFKGTDGVEVEGWLTKPTTGAPAPYPTILWIHGGPHGAQGHHFAFDTHMLAGAGYAVLYINHRASTGYGDAFSTGIKGDWGNLDYGDLMAGVDEAIARGLADADKLGCCGISGGGNLSCWIVGNTDRFKAAIPQNPVTNWVSFYGVSDIGVWFAVEELGGHPHEIPEVYAKCSPITYAHRCKTPTLLIQTEHDWRCPPEQSEQFFTVLRANGCTVDMMRHPLGSHGGSIMGPVALRKSHLAVTLDWFDRHILGKEATE